MRRALADALGLRPGAVALRLGATSRDKVFMVVGDEAEIATRLAGLRDANGGSHSVHGAGAGLDSGRPRATRPASAGPA